MKQKSTTVNAVSRSINILVALSNGNNTLSDIKNSLKLSASTTHRLLKTMENLQLVVQDSIGHHYHLGPLFLKLASDPVKYHYFLISSALEEMNRLSALFSETVYLTIMIGTQIVRLHQILSPHPLKVSEDTPSWTPITGGSIGKVLLSQLDDDDVKAILAIINLEPTTENSITEKERLFAHIRKARQQGYAVSHGERIANSIGVSAPIKNYPFPAALSVTGPKDRIKMAIPSLTEAITASANRISNNNEKIFKFNVEKNRAH